MAPDAGRRARLGDGASGRGILTLTAAGRPPTLRLPRARTAGEGWRSLARSLAEPVRLGRGASVFQPLVLGPEAVPILTDRERAAREPELATLSALAHHADKGGADVVISALAAASGLDERRRGLYVDLILSALGEATRRAIEAKMANTGYQYQSEFARTYFAQGEAEGLAQGVIKGKAESLLTLLDARGLKVTAGQRARVLACTDVELLESWVRRSVAITATAELFGSPQRVTKPSRLGLGQAGTGGRQLGQVLEIVC